MNCPARMGSVPESGLRGWLAEQGLRPRQIVCYLGSIGTNQGLPEAAASMRYWPPDTLLVLVGQASDSTRQGILAAARCAEGQRQVIFTGAKPHGEALALTAGADVALSLIQPKSLNLKFSAGAVNKRFEYMALGVPQVTDNGPGVSDIIERHQCGLCVDPQSPEAIGRAVRTLLDDGARRHTFAAAARQAHLERFYYERQFTPVADWIGAHCKPH
jgi:glycosyltransferase involved in cell wall biosynthesis